MDVVTTDFAVVLVIGFFENEDEEENEDDAEVISATPRQPCRALKISRLG